MQQSDGKVAFVTGAGRGIGRAIALRLAGAGAKVAVTDADETSAGTVAAECGERALGLRVDVTDPTRCCRRRAHRADAGADHVLVNNAGWDKMEPFLESTEETWDKVIAINLKGVPNCVKAILPGMVERGQGRIVSISSDAARVGSSGEAVYAAAKAGDHRLRKRSRERSPGSRLTSTSSALARPTPTCSGGRRRKLRLGDAPGAVPFGRLAEPDEIAAPSRSWCPTMPGS